MTPSLVQQVQAASAAARLHGESAAEARARAVPAKVVRRTEEAHRTALALIEAEGELTVRQLFTARQDHNTLHGWAHVVKVMVKQGWVEVAPPPQRRGVRIGHNTPNRYRITAAGIDRLAALHAAIANRRTHQEN